MDMQNIQKLGYYSGKRGLMATNNVAIRAANGKYVMRLDADDYLDSTIHGAGGHIEKSDELTTSVSDCTIRTR